MNKYKLAEYKSKYGPIYMLELEGFEVYYRSLTAWEVQSFLDLKGNSNKDKMEMERVLCTFAIIEPSTLPNFKAPGSLSSLANDIWTRSIPQENTMDSFIDNAREWAQKNSQSNYSIMLAMAVCKIIPSTDLVALLEVPASKLIRIAALVEEVSGMQFLKGEGVTKQKQASPITQGHDISQEEADATTSALADALRSQKRNLSKG